VDVANPDWQKFIGQLSQELYEKGVDGFFLFFGLVLGSLYIPTDILPFHLLCTLPNICRIAVRPSKILSRGA